MTGTEEPSARDTPDAEWCEDGICAIPRPAETGVIALDRRQFIESRA